MPGPTRHDGVLIPWLTPIRAAKGPLRNTGLLGSFVIHGVGTVFFLLVLSLFDRLFWGDNLAWEIEDAFEDDPPIALLLTAAWVLAYQLVFLLLAWMTTCWGAGVEPFRQSFGRSLSRWLQLTPWLALLTLCLILAMVGFEELEDWYWDQYNYARYGDYYDVHGYGQPMQLLTYDRFHLLLTAGRVGTLGIANLVWLWWILGTVAVHRDKPTWFASCRWPAVCEGCGYALAGLTDEQGCPECGKQVGSSKHTHRGTRDTPSLRMLIRGLIKPKAVGAAMVTRRPTKTPLRVLLWGLLFAVLAGPVMMIMMDIGERIGGGYGMVDGFGKAIEIYFLAGLTVGIYAALVGSLLLFAAGTLVGSIVRVMGKRNIMPATCNAACYSAALLPAWVLAQGVQLMILIPLAYYLEEIARHDLVDFFPMLVLLLHGTMLIYLTFHIASITKAARHANV